ncbi:hypothetical protein [Escherichia coli]|uniref:hypothetical protein n=1 Tax=Escherichia coli TaxID=562 RepID=UPI001431400E|nr:hypothetical protein [Escherichia coli]MDZ9723182.1 hypothetical protein [Escherichia coli]HCN7988047.1 hypothetical protein [Escherichia coli]
MFRILSYPMNVGVILLFGVFLSLFDLSSFYSPPYGESLAIILILAFSYIALSVFFTRRVVERNEHSASWKTFSIIAATGFFVEFILGGAPILVGRESAVTLPVLHVAFYSCAILSVLFASIYGSKKEMIISLFVVLILSTLMLSRQMMIVSFFIAVISYSSRVRFNKVMILNLLITIIALIFLFALVGNLRQQLSGDYVNDYIKEVGGANEQGMAIGDALYWIWLYIASPVYNLVANIDSYYNFGDSCNKALSFGSCRGDYVLSVLTPDTIAKHFSQPFEIDMVMKHLNAGTAFSASARIFGISGIYIQFVLQVIFYVLGFIFTNKRNRTAFVVYFSALSLFMIFDNLFIRGEFFFGFLLIIASGCRMPLIAKK